MSDCFPGLTSSLRLCVAPEPLNIRWLVSDNFATDSTSHNQKIFINYTSIDPNQQQRMFPPRKCAIQNSWNCLAHSCLLFYSFITSTVQIRGNKRDATHPGIHTEWRSLIFRRVQNWYKLLSLENNSASTNPCDFRLKRHSCP